MIALSPEFFQGVGIGFIIAFGVSALMSLLLGNVLFGPRDRQIDAEPDQQPGEFRVFRGGRR